MNRVDASVGVEVCTSVGVRVGTFACINTLYFQHNKTKKVNIPSAKAVVHLNLDKWTICDC